MSHQVFYKYGPFLASFYVLQHVIKKSLTPSENRLTAILKRKKLMSDPGFEPGLPRQNTIALPLVPPPFPKMSHQVRPSSVFLFKFSSRVYHSTELFKLLDEKVVRSEEIKND